MLKSSRGKGQTGRDGIPRTFLSRTKGDSLRHWNGPEGCATLTYRLWAVGKLVTSRLLPLRSGRGSVIKVALKSRGLDGRAYD